jgi:hypothetical protein
MQRFIWPLLWSCLIVAHGSATTITYQVTDPVTPGAETYTYAISGFTFGINEELDIEFDASLYGNLQNAVAGPGFSVMLFQPDDRPGLDWPGYYSLLAVVDDLFLNAQFSVDFTYLGTGEPGPQSYSISQFDQNGSYVSTLETGFTVAAATNGTGPVPEPSSMWLCVLGLLAVGAWTERRRRG